MGRIKIGNKKKPLILENELIDRPLITDNILKKELKFSDVGASGIDLYLFNLSGNPFISKQALRIGVFLYAYFKEKFIKTKGINWKMGEAFYISSKDRISDNHEEEEYFRCTYRGAIYDYPRPLKDLILELSEFGIDISSSNLIKALNELHNFHYITMSPRPVREVGGKSLYSRTCFRHIRIYQGMVDKPFYYYLNRKEKLSRNKDNQNSS
ncbi:hypothetical protein [Thalassotalea sediminis]|uniref:hypothetical protein n=1 Tax=Thalassotalea sediminis TaxID=1759089 RepID=UPI0025738AB4|nr:hypothetical protein [Thalassotalea sediminis]